MDIDEFWALIERARVPGADTGPDEGAAVAGRAAALLARRPVAEIRAAGLLLDGLLAGSYRAPLWGAAYLLGGGCSDDGFDYFRGWLLVQGREVFERVVAGPDLLAGLPVVRAAVAAGVDLECEEALGIAWHAHRAATGADLPLPGSPVRLPDVDPGWDFGFDDHDELSRRLPGLARLCSEETP